MKKVALNKRKPELGYFAIIDDDDFERVNKFNWTVLIGNTGIKYAVYKPRYKSFIYLHRFVINAPKGTIVDHKNRNGLDNRKSNLRLCNYSENAINSKIFRHNTSGFKGVRWNKTRRKWEAQIMIKQKHIHLGRFDSIKNALNARKEAEQYYFKNFI